MQTYYTKWFSPSVGREMEIKVYGHAGRPVLFIPCQDGRFFDFENYHMTDAWAPWIESGQCMVFSIDTLDKETYSATYDPHDRIRRHEAWMNYIVREVAPFIQSMTNDRNGWDGTPGVVRRSAAPWARRTRQTYTSASRRRSTGCWRSAAFTRSEYGFPGYMDELVYANSPVDYLAGISPDHPFIRLYNDHKAVVVVGQGAWGSAGEHIPPCATFVRRRTSGTSGSTSRGYEVKHDWDWWYQQVAYHVPHIL